ncbi:MAG: competence/damage-inducible protein A, partial [Oscillospiraceae bacterium]|nr:competence/damage-inducible protein A [Oscillospiraceae bacterium]
MTAEIIAVGTELLLGNIANTDARDISQHLSALGINVYFHTVVGDNPARLREAVAIARNRADILITTGGLGPTYDDLTKQTVAACFGLPLARHEETWTRIQNWFREVGRPLTPNNEQQAMLPEGCTIFQNDWGTAPGCAFEAAGKHVLMLPGPPRECLSMFEHCAVPYLRRLSGVCLVSRQVRIFGMGESAVEDKLRAFMLSQQNPTVAPYAKESEVMLRVTAQADTPEQAFALTEPAVAEIRRVLGGVVYGVDVDSLADRVAALLVSRGRTLALAESCTGGLISKRMTDVPGVSRVYKGGVCVYAPETKTALLGVPEALLAAHGAVSEPVARAMAEGALTRLGADFALGVTGLAGPAGDGSAHPPGTVFIALAERGAPTICQLLRLGADRTRVRAVSASHALDMLRR